MDRYVVTATLNGHTNAHIIQSPDSMTATMEAIAWIMDSAYAEKDGAWAVGAIKMYGPSGAVLHKMEAKA
jgi:hypothetical protein